MGAKIKANKLLIRLNAACGCGCKPDTWEAGWDDAITEAISIVEDEAEKANEKKKAKKKNKKKAEKATKPEVIPIQNTLVSELCPECDTEVTMSWDVDTDGYAAFCPYCGATLMLCSVCHDREHEEGSCYCDWNDDTQRCGKTPKEKALFEPQPKKKEKLFEFEFYSDSSDMRKEPPQYKGYVKDE